MADSSGLRRQIRAQAEEVARRRRTAVPTQRFGRFRPLNPSGGRMRASGDRVRTAALSNRAQTRTRRPM